MEDLTQFQQKNEKRNEFVMRQALLQSPHPANEAAVDAYRKSVGELSVEANRENIGVEWEIDVLISALLRACHMDRAKANAMVKEAVADIPQSSWLQLQLAQKLEEDLAAAEEARKREEKEAKKRGEIPGQMKLTTTNA